LAKRKIKLRKRMAEVLDLPEDIVLDVPKLTLIGNETMLIENHSGIYEYSDDIIRLNTPIGLLSIAGLDLVLKELSLERLYVTGIIYGVNFEGKKKTKM
jgi:sporulation protein YqfC